MLSAINCCSNHVKNASIPLVARPRYYATLRIALANLRFSEIAGVIELRPVG